MDQATAVTMVQEALLTAIMLAAPMLGLSMIVGLSISIFQTTTSIQEQTLTFVPKILSIIMALAVFGNWMLSMLLDYTVRLWSSFPELVP